MSAWSSSGVSIIMTSLTLAASAGVMTVKPAASALARVGEPAFSAMTTSLTPESRRFCAWAWPWLP